MTPRPPRAVQLSRLSLWFGFGLTLFAAFTLDVSAFTVIGGSGLFGYALGLTGALIVLGAGLWLTYRRLPAAVWLGIGGSGGASLATASIPLTAPPDSNPAGLWVLAISIAAATTVFAVLSTRPDARAYFANR